jgi:hypothetical protein
VHSSKPPNSKHNKTSSSTALQQTRRQTVEDLHQILRCRRRRIPASKDRKISGGVIPCPAHWCFTAASERHPARLGRSLLGRVYGRSLRHWSQCGLPCRPCGRPNGLGQQPRSTWCTTSSLLSPAKVVQKLDLELAFELRLGLSLTFPARS